MPWFRKEPKEDIPAGNVASIAKAVTEMHLSERCFRIDVPYILPRDIEEASRLNFQHHMLRNALQGNYLVPLRAPCTILDVGSGTGRWAFDLCQEFPQTRVVGIDLADNLQSTESTLLNYQFVQGDVLKGLPFPNSIFSFVHQRFLAMGLPVFAWSALFSEMMRVTEPGGWIEIREATHQLRPQGEAGRQLERWTEQICQQRGIDPMMPERIGAMLQSSAELRNVETPYLDLPVGNWGGRVGSLMAKNYLTLYESVKPLYVHQLQIPVAQYEHVLSQLIFEWEINHPQSRLYAAYGQRTGGFGGR